MNHHYLPCAPCAALLRYVFPKHWLLALTLLVFAETAHTQTTWTGAVNTSWTVAGNWTAGIPTAADDVTIPGTANKPIILNNAMALAKSVQLADVTSQLTINTGGSLTISGSSGIGLDMYYFAILTIQAGAQLTINGTGGDGIYSLGNVYNNGTIHIGNLAGIGGKGWYNNYDRELNNNAGGLITIDNTGNDGLENFGKFVNNGTLEIGSLAPIGDDGIYNSVGSVNNTAQGTISISWTASDGILNSSAMTVFNNSGTITVTNAGINGIHNRSGSTFNNNAGSQISIENTANDGIDNDSNIFNNSGNIMIGSGGAIGEDGISNFATTFNNNTGGNLQINGTGQSGISCGFGTFTNSANIDIGSLSPININGISNRAGNVQNNASGTISIRWTAQDGISLNSSGTTFSNAGQITIQDVASGKYSIGNNDRGVFTNAPCTAVIHVSAPIYTDLSPTTSFNNYGSIIETATDDSNITSNSGIVQNLNGGTFTVGSGNAAITTSATIWTGCTNTNWNVATNWHTGSVPTAADDVIIPNATNDPVIMSGTMAVSMFVTVQAGAVLTVNSGGSLSINGGIDYGMFNYGTVNNTGTINFGNTAASGGVTMVNVGIFHNYVGGSIYIDRAGPVGIYNDGTFTNYALVDIGAISSGGDAIYNLTSFVNEGGTITIHRAGRLGIYNVGGTFNNKAGSAISIDQTTQDGIYNLAAFINAADIIIGAAVGPLITGIDNETGTFHNNPGGNIRIDRTGLDGLYNSATFVNAAQITIGSLGSIGLSGIRNNASFSNNVGANINIDHTVNDGLVNLGGTFTNKATLTIGASANIGHDGIFNTGTFVNESSDLTIDRTSNIGIYNVGGSFTNQANLRIGALAAIGTTGILNTATFNNTSCAVLLLFSNINNNASFTNSGLFTVNTAQTHTNSGLTNNGIIEYPQGNPIPNVTNNDLIVAPITGACGISNVLQQGGALSFTVGSTWYTDPGLSIVAGTYNQATNTLDVSSLAPGQYTLYFSITDNVNGCARTVSISLNNSDITPPIVVCKNYTAQLDANGAASITPTNVFQSGSDDCGTINLVSVSPATFTCNNTSGPNPVTLTVSDGNGNTNTCTATVTVVDNISPTVVCKNATVNLNVNGTGSIIPGDVFQSGTDNCVVVNLLFVLPNTFTCSDVGTKAVTLLVELLRRNYLTINVHIFAKISLSWQLLIKMFGMNGNGKQVQACQRSSFFLY